MPFNFNFPTFGNQNQFKPFNPIKRPNSGPGPFGAGLNPYQPNVPIPAPQIQQPQEEPLVNFADEYAKLTANRPNRMAYQQQIEQGAPQIQRGKWAKLGALLAAGGTSLGQNSATAGMNLGLSAYQEPQRQSDELYKQRVAGLGNLANMEDSDIQDKIKALEMQRSDWYKSQENTRQNEANERDKLMTNINIKNIQSVMDDRDTDKWDDENTGWHWERKPGGIPTPVYKNKRSPAEIMANKVSETTAVETAKQPFDVASDERKAKADEASDKRSAASSLANVRESNKGKADVADITAKNRAALVAQRLQAKSNSLKPDDVRKAVYNDLAIEIGAERMPPEAASYIKDNNGTLESDAGWFGDDALAKKVGEFISASMAKSKGGTNNAPNPASNTQQNQPMNKQVQGPDGRVITVYSYDGGKTWGIQ